MKIKLLKEEKLTLSAYEKDGVKWAAEHNDSDRWSPDFIRLKKYLPKGKILEIGSGGGRDAKKLHQLGYTYVGTDISKTLLKVAQKQNPNLKFFHKSVYNLDFTKNSFDGFWACAVLLHIPKSRIDEALQNIVKIVKNNGIGFISVKQGDGESIVDDTLDNGTNLKRFFAYYQLEEFANVLKRNAFKILNSEIRKVSEKTTWLIYFVRVIKN